MLTIINNPGATAPGYISTVANVLDEPGTSVTDAYQTLAVGVALARHDDGIAPKQEAFVDAIRTGDSDLISRATLEWRIATIDLRELLNETDRDVAAALRVEYATTADHNYEAIAAAFNKTASELAKCATAVDIDLTSDQIVLRSEKERQAWSAAPFHAKELDRLLDKLQLAATLAQLPYRTTGGNHNDDAHAVAVDPHALTKRSTWAHIETPTHRAGKWGALIQAGITVHAPDATDVRPTPRPGAKRLEYVRNGIGWVMKEIEDGQD